MPEEGRPGGDLHPSVGDRIRFELVRDWEVTGEFEGVVEYYNPDSFFHSGEAYGVTYLRPGSTSVFHATVYPGEILAILPPAPGR